jgi:DNA processing protein
MSDPSALCEALTDRSQRAAVRLSMVSGIGPRLYRQLVESFGSAESVLRAAPAALRGVRGIGAKLAREISRAEETIDVDAEWTRCRQFGIDLIASDAAEYPQRLKEIADPPAILYCQGKLLPRDALAIAIVGTRHATTYGQSQAERFAKGLALAGVTIVSGLARGIDSSAHRGALVAQGRTIAVLGSGILNLYPPDHRPLADEIARQGALLSEFPSLQPPKAGAFPQRNRLISGLSLGVLVVEAAIHSGALITARHAMEQGREVFAIPGRIDQRNARGCHQLIRDGAKLVETIDDILEELGPLPVPADVDGRTIVHHPAELSLNEREQAVLQAIDAEPTSIDQLVARTKLPVQHILSTISILEMRRLVRRVSGHLLVRS